MYLTIPKEWDNQGLGTVLCAISVINDSKYTTINFSTETYCYFLFKDIISLYKLNLEVVVGLDPTNVISFGDLSKLNCPYIKKDVDYKRNSFIGLAMYPGTTDVTKRIPQSKKNKYPWNKLYTIDEYKEVFRAARLHGYDVITIDSRKLDLQKKIELLSMCRAVIGYEGGVAHLTHTLGIPYFMLPWRNVNKEPLRKSQTHALHMDLKTYFLNDITELLYWNKKYFHKVLRSLDDENGNNLWLNMPEKNRMLDDNWNYFQTLTQN